MNLPHTFAVVPRLPAPLEPLRTVAYNMWWAWNADARALFRDLDPELWDACGHGPASMLRRISQKRLAAAAGDAGYVKRVQAVQKDLERYIGRRDRWFRKQAFPEQDDFLVGYFSAEFGFHESLQTYSGGLGILAGDHCKSASDLGLPFVAVGLMYRQGYFIQRLNGDGWQESEYITWDFHDLPITEVRHANNEPVRVTVQLPHRPVKIRAWEAKVGLSRIFFLDTDLAENREDDRRITYQLYGGDHEMRIKQEIVLGIGGKRFLRAIGLNPTVFHMNEGHAAFLALERIRRPVVEEGADFYSVVQTVAASSVFTTHTPVPAGNDAFSPELMHAYFADFARELGIGFDEFLKYGRPWKSTPHEPFSMTILALRLSRFCNGVSRIHGGVSREMWQSVWPGVPGHEIPIGHITNGIHTQTWIAPEIKSLVESKTGPIWETDVSEPAAWKGVESIPDEQLWATHLALKRRLVDFARANVRAQRIRTRESARSIQDAAAVLSPDVLTIGFARRFATYKRAGLLFRDPERLARIVNNEERPVQFVFAGKSHPADGGGKELIQAVFRMTRRPEFNHRVVFLENYDIDVARHMYHGVDVWLNTPTRPLEASGTSGEKVCPNGAINCSVLDGWWAEAWRRHVNGWAVGEHLDSHDPEVQNDFDADSLYTLLEHEIAPLFYAREGGIPRQWIQMMKQSMMTVSPAYSTFRMVQDYTRNYYLPASERGARMQEHNFAKAAALSAWKSRVRENWHAVRVAWVKAQAAPGNPLTVGDEFTVETQIELGALSHQDVTVEAYVASEDGDPPAIFPLAHAANGLYRGGVTASDSGVYRFNVRILPSHPDLVQKHELRLICWAEG